MKTKEELQAMSTGEIVGMVAELTLNPDEHLSQDYLRMVQTIVEDRDSNHEALEDERGRLNTVRDDAHFTMKICSQRPGADTNAPRQVRISGDALECPQRTKRDDETDEDYFNSLPSIDCHVNELIHLLTVGRYQVLKALDENIDDHEIVELKSMFDPSRTYHRIVAYFDEEEDVPVQIARKNDPAEAKRIMHQLTIGLQHAAIEADQYTQPTMDIRIDDKIRA